MYPAKGKVLLKDDKPLSAGRVVFTLQGRGLDFSAPISADGTFTMTSQFGDGIPEGSYLVRVEPEAPTTLGPAGKKPAAKGAWTQPYPESYSDETTSGLTAKVNPGENTLEPFKLVPQAGAARAKSGKAGGRGED
ncbi:peptidase associated/transthyretin-like domain-containing protein [Aquisphaera giovannonii]|uniref:hypothetical protein n=1 Tax=Aquisphaera giovannonii TaxID=406548 RepID=UPI0011DFA5DC|nr:hypothetical protein [Aquisphaera giovannonii]